MSERSSRPGGNQGSPLGDVGGRHRTSTSATLDFAWDAGVFRSDHVMAALGLTRSTALAALNTLVGLGLIRVLPSASTAGGSGPGRPARRFQLRAEAGVMVGIEAGERQYRAVATDLAGGHLAKVQIDASGSNHSAGVEGADPQRRRALAFRALDSVLAAAGRPREDVIGVGVGVPAPVNAGGVSPPDPRGRWQRVNAGLGAAFGAEFPAVRVENDAALAAVAEGVLGEARGHDNFVAILGGRRLGAGVFLGGRLMRGAHGGVGELDGLGDAAGFAVRSSAENTVLRPPTEELARTLGRICGIVTRFYDPDLLVFCGAAAGVMSGAIEMAHRDIRTQTELPSAGVVASRLGADVVALGAAAAVREDVRGVVLDVFSSRSGGARR